MDAPAVGGAPVPGSTADATIQVSLAPVDARHAEHILPHQLRQWAGQVGEVLLTVDLHRSRGRFAASTERQLERLQRVLDDQRARWPHARIVEVDYSAGAVARVGRAFFGGATPPKKDYRGGPFYHYFFALDAARHDYVLHVDSDMLFGGGSQRWVRESVTLLDSRPEVVVSSPLPGPPTPDGSLTTQASVRESSPAFAHRFHSFSTRVFLVHRGRFAERLGPLRARLAHPRGVLRALVEGNPPFRLPERLVTERMVERGLARVDFLGTAPGMWSLHPPYRNEAFYERLPELIASVEAGRVPDAQRGDYDMNDSMVDWSDARAAVRRNRWRAPLARLLR